MKTLAKEHQFVALVRPDANAPDWEIATQYGGWRSLGPNSFCSANYFDLAGLSMDDKTLFFEASGVQTVLAPLANRTGAGDSCLVMDLMSTRPLTDTQLLTTIATGNFAGNAATDGQGPLSFEETVYARTQMFVRHVDTSAWGYITMTDENFFGSMEPTASDRIYSYRVVVVSQLTTGTSMTELTIYGARHLLQATVKEEPEFQYLMRLMKSYQLQQFPDED